MPNIKSAEKRARQSERRKLVNRRNLSQMRTAIKKFRTLVAQKKFDEAHQALPELCSVIDRSAQKGVIHANSAARYKSRLSKHLHELKGAGKASV